MSKYIDADRLRDRIKKNKYVIEPMFLKGDDSYYEGEDDGYNRILSIIDSLQQEQQEVDLDSEIEEYWIATGWSKVITLGKFKVIARYFYGLGQLNSK